MISRRTMLQGTCALPLLAACNTSKPDPQAPISVAGGQPTSEFHGHYLADGWELPDVELTDQDGNPFNLRTGWKTPAAALFFGYLQCPDVCPGIMADMATARRRLDQGLAEQITPILVTTDPARDTPAALKEYLARVDPTFIGLTGDLELIKDVGKELNVAIEQGKQLPSGGYEVDHSTQILGVGNDKQVHVVWTTLGLEVGHLREDYARLIDDGQ